MGPEQLRPTRGRLVTYLGTAPGVGKTFRMLTDGRARAQAGEDVVIGWMERHGRAAIHEQARPLEVSGSGDTRKMLVDMVQQARRS